MKNNFIYNATMVDKNESTPKSIQYACKWISSSQNQKELNYKNILSKFLISSHDDYCYIIDLLLKTKHSLVEVIIDEKISNTNLDNLQKLQNKYINKIQIFKTNSIINESYFNIENNLLISSATKNRNYIFKEETAITNAGKQMMKDFNKLYNEYKNNSKKIYTELSLEQ